MIAVQKGHYAAPAAQVIRDYNPLTDGTNTATSPVLDVHCSDETGDWTPIAELKRCGTSGDTGLIIFPNGVQISGTGSFMGSGRYLTNLQATAIEGLPSVATSGAYPDLTGRPVLGSAAAQDVSAFDSAGAAAAAQAVAVQRANQTGTQAISTVAGLQSALDAKLPLSGGTLAGNFVGSGTANRLPNQVGGTSDAIMTQSLTDSRIQDAETNVLDIPANALKTYAANGGNIALNQWGSAMNFATGTVANGIATAQAAYYVNDDPSSGNGICWVVPWKIVIRIYSLGGATADTNFYLRVGTTQGWPVGSASWHMGSNGAEVRISGNGTGVYGNTAQLNVFSSGTIHSGPVVGNSTPALSNGVGNGFTYLRIESDGVNIFGYVRPMGGPWVSLGSLASPGGYGSGNVVMVCQNSGSNPGASLTVNVDMIKMIDSW
jgi:hypothetical protein